MDLTVFISYSWDSEEHKDWVRRFADLLIEQYSLEVILDQYDLENGDNLALFMESALEKADYVLVIMTPDYKISSDNRKNGVGYEYSMISSDLIEIQNNNKKFIPILRKGNKTDSIPKFLKAFKYHDMRDDLKFNNDVDELARFIWNKPKKPKPKKGSNIKFNELELDPVLEISEEIIQSKDLNVLKANYFQSQDAATNVYKELKEEFEKIKLKAEEYRNKTKLFFRVEYRARQNHFRLVLLTEDYSLNVYYHIPLYGYLDNSEIRIATFKGLLRINNDYFMPSDQPECIHNEAYKPEISDDLTVKWKCGEKSFYIKQLKEIVFIELLRLIKNNIK